MRRDRQDLPLSVPILEAAHPGAEAVDLFG